MLYIGHSDSTPAPIASWILVRPLFVSICSGFPQAEPQRMRRGALWPSIRSYLVATRLDSLTFFLVPPIHYLFSSGAHRSRSFTAGLTSRNTRRLRVRSITSQGRSQGEYVSPAD